MGSVRVGQVAGYINLMGFHLLQELSYNLHILFGHGILFDLSTLIERKVEEMHMV